jgi:hypothetical protein
LIAAADTSAKFPANRSAPDLEPKPEVLADIGRAASLILGLDRSPSPERTQLEVAHHGR